jgi:hypothetical protein
VAGEPWRVTAGGLEIRVRLTPRGGRDAIEGVGSLSDGTPVLKARVRAAPEDGAANEALRGLVAGRLGVPPGAVALTTGHCARLKTLRVAGDGPALARALPGVPA